MQSPSSPFVAPRSLQTGGNDLSTSPSPGHQSNLPYLFVRNIASPSKPAPPLNQPAAEEEEKPKRRKRITLSEATLLEPNGLWMLYDGMQKLPLSRKRGREGEDMSRVMSAYRVWASTLFPRLEPDVVLAKVNKLSGKSAINDAMANLRSNCEIPRALLGYLPFEASTHEAVLSKLHTATKSALDLKYEKNQNRSKNPSKSQVGGENVTYNDDWSGEEEETFNDEIVASNASDDAIAADTTLDFTDLLRSNQQQDKSHTTGPNPLGTQLNSDQQQFGVESSSIASTNASNRTLCQMSSSNLSKPGKLIVVQKMMPSAPSSTQRANNPAGTTTTNTMETLAENTSEHRATDWDKVLEEIAQ